MQVTELELWSYTFRRSNLVELAAAAAAAGFACVTTTPSLFVRSGGHDADLHARVADHGVRVTFIDGLCTALPGTNLPPGEPTIDDCIAMAHATGAGAINVVHATGVPTPVDELPTRSASRAGARPPRTCGWRSSSFPTPASPTSPPRPRSCGKPVRRTGRCCSTPGTARVAGRPRRAVRRRPRARRRPAAERSLPGPGRRALRAPSWAQDPGRGCAPARRDGRTGARGAAGPAHRRRSAQRGGRRARVGRRFAVGSPTRRAPWSRRRGQFAERGVRRSRAQRPAVSSPTSVTDY